MSRPARLVILCEDLQSRTFVTRFFKQRGWRESDFRSVLSPPGEGSAEQFVRERFPGELRAYRSQKARRRLGLVVCMDADAMSLDQRLSQLENACSDAGVEPPRNDDSVLFVIPKRNIETWFAYLRGEPTNEVDAYPRYDEESECQGDVERLNEMCIRGSLEGNPPDSLIECCKGFGRFSDPLVTQS